jgi:hypothetical protein
MALHRDIYWVGRQWAVTGYGMQAVDQRLKGIFDVEVSRLWDDGLLESLNAGEWLNAEDFAKGLFIAQAKYPEPARKAPLFDPPELRVSPLEDIAPVEPPEPVPQNFDMRIESWTAKLVPPWRVLRQR